jgi:hypothetical protein
LFQSLKSETPTEDGAKTLAEALYDLDALMRPPSGPLVAAVAPMNDAQMLDLQNSERSQVALGLELAAALRSAGLAAQADTITQYVNRKQRDAATRTENVVVNAYSIAGGHFGFEIAPSFRASDNPSTFSKSSDVLARQSFPVLLIIGLENMDLRPQILKDAKVVLEPRLVITQTSCWHPLSVWRGRWSDAERLDMTRQLAVIENEIGRVKEAEARANKTGSIDMDDPAADTGREALAIANLAEVRLHALRAKLCGGKTQQYFPPDFIKAQHYNDHEPEVSELIPGKVTLKVDSAGKVQPQNFTIRLLGTNLDRVDTHGITIVGEDQTKPLEAKRNAGTLVVTVPVKDAGAPVVLELDVPGAKPHSIYSLPLLVAKESPAPVKPFIQRTTSGGSDRLEFQGVSDDVLKAEIEKSKVPPQKTKPPSTGKPNQGPQTPPKAP